MQLRSDFEIGVSGNDVLTSDAGSPNAWELRTIGAGGSIKYDSAQKHGGLLSAKFIAGTAVSYIGWSGSVGTPASPDYGRLYIRINANTNPSDLITFRITGDTDYGGMVTLLNTRKLRIQNRLGSGQGDTTNALSLDTWHRVEWRHIPSLTVGLIELKLYLDGNVEGATPDETLTASNIDTNASFGAIRFGMDGNSAVTMWLDDVEINDTGYPGSSAPFVPKIVMTGYS